jgi:hypothetical protein
MVKKKAKSGSIYSIISVLFKSPEQDKSRPQTLEVSLLHFNIVFRLGLDAFILGFETRILYMFVISVSHVSSFFIII